jgi:hypothetical protein
LRVIGVTSEPLGPNERVDEIDEQHDGHDAAEGVIEDHLLLPRVLSGDRDGGSEAVAEMHVAEAQGEAADAEGDVENVEHADGLATGLSSGKIDLGS